MVSILVIKYNMTNSSKSSLRKKERKLWKFDSKHHAFIRSVNNEVIDAVVDRVAFGNLVYVTDAKNKSHSFTPDCVRVRSLDGTLRRYRGEPLDSIGLKEGATVVIKKRGKAETVIVKNKRLNAFQRFRNSILGS